MLESQCGLSRHCGVWDAAAVRVCVLAPALAAQLTALAISGALAIADVKPVQCAQSSRGVVWWCSARSGPCVWHGDGGAADPLADSTLRQVALQHSCDIRHKEVTHPNIRDCSQEHVDGLDWVMRRAPIWGAPQPLHLHPAALPTFLHHSHAETTRGSRSIS